MPSASAVDGASGVSREPVKVRTGSPMIVPIVMFGAMTIGAGIILFNYLTEGILGTPNNWYLWSGLALVLVGIIAATQYR